jgi:hypothetical protein
MSAEHQDMIRDIDKYLADITSMGNDSDWLILFATESKAVSVRLGGKLNDSEGASDDTRARLLVGYVAGSVRAQLLSGIKKPSPVDATKGMLAVYVQLKLNDPEIDVPLLEELGALTAGELEARVTAIVASDE